VWWVELADLTDPALVPHTVARALGIQPAANQSPSDAIALHFQQRQALLVLDNCEHALPSCIPLVRQLLQRCGNLCILTTSREPLCILGETVILTPPLSLPSLANTLLAHELSESDSVRLFIERARSVQPDFALTDASAPTVAAICRRLDGIPLAIELAAAQLASMSLEQLAHRLHNRFEWLIDGNSAAPARQHTLRATFDWSYALLNDAECVLFRRLSVFSGGWTREAAEAVVADDGPDTQGDIAHTPLHRDSVAPLLQHLVAMSLVVVQWTHDEPRYRMLETIREYASVKLTEAGERRPLRDRHCRHFVELVRAHHDDLHGPDRLLWLDRFDAERDNFRAALSHAEAGADGHAGLTMASHLGHFWHERGYWSEGRNWLTVLLERQPATQPPLTRCRALQVAAVLAADLDDFSAAQDLAHRSIELAQGIEGGGSVLPRAYLTLAWALLPSNSPSAYEMIQRSIEASRSAGDDWSLAYAQSFAGALLPDPAAARDALELSVALFRRVGDTASVATPETLLGELLLREGDFVRARVHLESALVVHRRMVSRRWIADTLKHLGVAAEMAGDLDAARSYLEESRELWRSLGSRQRTADTLGALARVARLSGDLEQAGLLCGESVRLCIDLPDRSALLHAVGGAACHLVARGEYALAIRAFGAINAAVRSADIRIRPDEWRLFDQCINAARDAVGIDAYLTHYSEGSAWPLDEIGQRCIQWVGAGSSHA
jgi:predicted ATPase/antitoxin component of MazEF toxin-antitoxin module